ncbi:hypothetical protein [Kribbella shirazensis]|uniref:Uncharacterized protein n=1 Tax=Kribbella shirazensis TaxID=1105143 RepID=A0A7X6A2L4_9ACTN|nr:hypothetical protein [Kribbella shirazensis]NIK59060.1 hypothetical protein [Kribbella shirazensis]
MQFSDDEVTTRGQLGQVVDGLLAGLSAGFESGTEPRPAGRSFRVGRRWGGVRTV